jgi:hypothetical protein
VSVDKGGRALVPLPREAGGAGLTPAELEAQRRSLLATSALGARLSPRLRAVGRPAAAVAAAVPDEVDLDLRRHEARETEPVRLLDWHERPTDP